MKSSFADGFVKEKIGLDLEEDVVVVVVMRDPSVVVDVVCLVRVLVLPSRILTFSSLAFFTTLRPEPTLRHPGFILR